MLKDGRKPGLPMLTKHNMEDAPEDTRWVEAVKTTVNGAVEQIDHLRSNANGIKLLTNADVEMADVDVQVPDPWIQSAEANFQNGWTDDVGVFFCKHPSGIVELNISIASGVAGAVFVLPIGYRPTRTIIFVGRETTPGTQRITIGTDGTVTMLTGADTYAYISFLASDSTPVPLSCWPKLIKTKFTKVAAVMVGGVYDAQTSEPLPAGAVHPVAWEQSNMEDSPQVKLLNIAGLPYNRKSRVRLLIFGG